MPRKNLGNQGLKIKGTVPAVNSCVVHTLYQVTGQGRSEGGNLTYTPLGKLGALTRDWVYQRKGYLLLIQAESERGTDGRDAKP